MDNPALLSGNKSVKQVKSVGKKEVWSRKGRRRFRSYQLQLSALTRSKAGQPKMAGPTPIDCECSLHSFFPPCPWFDHIVHWEKPQWWFFTHTNWNPKVIFFSWKSNKYGSWRECFSCFNSFSQATMPAQSEALVMLLHCENCGISRVKDFGLPFLSGRNGFLITIVFS